MGKITGLGGIFISSENNSELSDWYSETLGLPKNEHGVNEFKWKESETKRDAFSIFHVFNKSDDYIKPSNLPVMVNFRVEGLDDLLEDLKSKGVKVYPEIQQETYGRFAWIEDSDGNKVELWEPTA